MKISIGDRFNRLIVVGSIKGTHTVKKRYICKCDCGGEIITSASELNAGNVKSCKCLQNEVRGKNLLKHGHTRVGKVKRIYNVYQGMVARCYYTKNAMYKNYGGRGIIVCDRWLESYINFYEDMGEPEKGYSLERIDVNGNYEPSNCKWATAKEQAGNKRNNVYGYWKGEKLHVAEISRRSGLSLPTVTNRIRQGIDIDSPRINPWADGGKRRSIKV